jgi:hypothetical protein
VCLLEFFAAAANSDNRVNSLYLALAGIVQKDLRISGKKMNR